MRTPSDRHGRILDAYSVAIIPSQQRVELLGQTAISDGVYFCTTAALIAEVNTEYVIDFEKQMASVKSLAILPRTNWLNEIMHRYVYERVVSRKQGNDATRFLEKELVKEIYYRIEEYTVRDKSRFDLDSKATDLRSPMLRAAMEFI